MLRDYFKDQIEAHAMLTEDVLSNVEYKRVWSGAMMDVGDKVLYALAFPKGEEDPKMMSLLERELEDLHKIFDFVRYEKETIPVLKFKDDPKVRNV